MSSSGTSVKWHWRKNYEGCTGVGGLGCAVCNLFHFQKKQPLLIFVALPPLEISSKTFPEILSRKDYGDDGGPEQTRNDNHGRSGEGSPEELAKLTSPNIQHTLPKSNQSKTTKTQIISSLLTQSTPPTGTMAHPSSPTPDARILDTRVHPPFLDNNVFRTHISQLEDIMSLVEKNMHGAPTLIGDFVELLMISL